MLDPQSGMRLPRPPPAWHHLETPSLSSPTSSLLNLIASTPPAFHPENLLSFIYVNIVRCVHFEILLCNLFYNVQIASFENRFIGF